MRLTVLHIVHAHCSMAVVYRRGTYFWKHYRLILFWTNVLRSSHTEVFLRKGVLKTCSKVTGENPGGRITIMILYIGNESVIVFVKRLWFSDTRSGNLFLCWKCFVALKFCKSSHFVKIFVLTILWKKVPMLTIGKSKYPRKKW